LRDGLNAIAAKNSSIKLVRGKGLLNSDCCDEEESQTLHWEICLVRYGLLANLQHKIRFTSFSYNRRSNYGVLGYSEEGRGGL
jgi:ornithine--oxo-acid transaminase